MNGITLEVSNQDITNQMISKMLKENTGSHMLDSGSVYGRNYEKNQIRKFELESPSVLEVAGYGFEVTHNLYHWLKDRITYDKSLDKLWNNFIKLPDNIDDNYHLCMYNFPDYLKSLGYEINGLYNEDDSFIRNTYNNECALSQVIQYLYFSLSIGDNHFITKDTIKPGEYILLQIHNGCDIRGGYTKPVIFSLNDETEILYNANSSILCNNCGLLWFSDDTCNYYQNHQTLKDLCYGSDNYEFIDLSDPDNKHHIDKIESIKRQRDLNQDINPLFNNFLIDVLVDSGIIYYYSDNNSGLCPLCFGKLYGGI